MQKQVPSRKTIRDANGARRPDRGLCRDDNVNGNGKGKGRDNGEGRSRSLVGRIEASVGMTT